MTTPRADRPNTLRDIPPTLLITVRDHASAERWLRELQATGYAWNPEDPADSVGNSPRGTFVRLFDDEVAAEMEHRMAECARLFSLIHIIRILNPQPPETEDPS